MAKEWGKQVKAELHLQQGRADRSETCHASHKSTSVRKCQSTAEGKILRSLAASGSSGFKDTLASRSWGGPKYRFRTIRRLCLHHASW